MKKKKQIVNEYTHYDAPGIILGYWDTEINKTKSLNFRQGER